MQALLIKGQVKNLPINCDPGGSSCLAIGTGGIEGLFALDMPSVTGFFLSVAEPKPLLMKSSFTDGFVLIEGGLNFPLLNP